jgi:hypothetical protein
MDRWLQNASAFEWRRLPWAATSSGFGAPRATTGVIGVLGLQRQRHLTVEGVLVVVAVAFVASGPPHLHAPGFEAAGAHHVVEGLA